MQSSRWFHDAGFSSFYDAWYIEKDMVSSVIVFELMVDEGRPSSHDLGSVASNPNEKPMVLLMIEWWFITLSWLMVSYSLWMGSTNVWWFQTWLIPPTTNLANCSFKSYLVVERIEPGLLAQWVGSALERLTAPFCNDWEMLLLYDSRDREVQDIEVVPTIEGMVPTIEGMVTTIEATR